MDQNARNEIIQIGNHCPSFFQNSCPGSGAIEEVQANHRKTELSKGCLSVLHEIPDPTNQEGWTKFLSCFPGDTTEVVGRKLIGELSSLPGKSILWKEGFLGNIFVKKKVHGETILFPIRSKVHASMKNTSYNVLVHMNQISGDFIVYTEVDMYVERIMKDSSKWENKMVPELTDFYNKYILPKIM